MKSNLIFAAMLLLTPLLASADGGFSFSTDPQTIAAGAVSGAITVAADAPVSQTTCILLSSTSSSGEFSSSASNWSPVAAVSMSRNTSNRTFYYEDSSPGSYTITAKVAPKGDDVSASCASWSDAASSVQATLTQAITVGGGGQTQAAQNDAAQTSQSQTAQQAAAYTGGGSETLVPGIKTQSTVIAGGGSYFSGSATDSKGNLIANARYLWNFGDGATAEGQTVFHTYVYPGTYAVELSVGADSRAGIGRADVQAVQAQLGLLAESDGSIVLSNQSSHELNIGLWSITSGTTTFTIPQNTILLSGGSIQFAPSVMNMKAGSDAELRYPNSMPVTVIMPTQPKTVAAAAGVRKVVAAPTVHTAAPVHGAEVFPSVSATSAPAAAAKAGSLTPLWSWGLGAMGVLLIALGLWSSGTLPRLRRNGAADETTLTADEFEITD